MASESSFDIVNKVDRQEVDNAVNQAAKEISQRFDFKNVDAGIKLSGEAIDLQANTEERVNAVLDVLKDKLVKRQISLKGLEADEPKLSGKIYKINASISAGITQETNAYDQVGNKTSAKDGEGKETRFTYDAANRLSERTDGFGTPDAALTTYKYDANGNRVEERDARLASLGEPWSIKSTYDPLNRLETTTDAETDVTRYGYDEEGNRTSVIEPEPQETTYAYDELGKLLRVVQPGNRVTSYQYDQNRNRVLQTDANGHEVRMTYDELDRMDALVQDPSGLAFRTSHAYDANGNETVLTDPKGQTVTSTYDELNRLKTKAYAYPASDPVRPWRHTTSIAYAYDANGNVTRIEDSVASGTDPSSALLVTTREYDDLDRLLSETSPLPDGGSRTVAYTYFANGTRKTVTGLVLAVLYAEYVFLRMAKAWEARRAPGPQGSPAGACATCT
jgi:YD repeat-containing protein